MNVSHDNLFSALMRPACGLVLIGVLAAPSGASTFSSPQRASSITPVTSKATYKSRSGRNGDVTYLAMIGPAPIAFAAGERPLPPEPVLPVLPKPILNAVESTAKNSVPAADATASAKPNSPDATELNAGITTSSEKPVSILPDDMRREIRPEDVLPFFQFPGASDGGGMILPSPSQAPRGPVAPPSSATYQQQ